MLRRLIALLLPALYLSAAAQGPLDKVGSYRSDLVSFTIRAAGDDNVVLEIETPARVFPTLVVDVNGDGRLDPRLDTYYAVMAKDTRKPCIGYVLTLESTTGCGTAPSRARLQVREGARRWQTWTLPRAELDPSGLGAHFLLQVYDERPGPTQGWTEVPGLGGGETPYSKAFEWNDRPRMAPSATPAAPATASATLRLTTTPGGVQVYVDDAFKGESSAEGVLVVEGVAAGEHTLRLNRADYRQWTQKLSVAAGEARSLEAALALLGPKPFLAAELEEMLEKGVSAVRAAQLVKRYGVAFELTAATESRLRSRGADAELLLAVMRSRK